KPCPCLLVPGEAKDVLTHLRRRPRHEVVDPLTEQSLPVRPGSRDQRDSARQRLEWANRRDPREPLHIRAPWDVQGHPRSRENFRHPVIDDPAPIVDSRLPHLPQRAVRITHPMYRKAQLAKLTRRTDQVVANLLRSL